MNVLVIDVGGTHIKMLATARRTERKFKSGPQMTAAQMASGVKRRVAGWRYDAVAIGYPGSVLRGRPSAEPHNLGTGWVDFDYEAAFGRPVRIINDAAMQALGAYRGGKMLFLGLGTGLGSAMVVDRIVVPMELAHLPYRKKTFEDYVGVKALKKRGKKKWRDCVADVIERLVAALLPEDVVIGGGNAEHLKQLPIRCRLTDNGAAFVGGFRLWEIAHDASSLSRRAADGVAKRGTRA
ncbi:MAG: ROK family protein [Casimicrobiaceae bacterium]